MINERIQSLIDRFPDDVSAHYQQMVPSYQKGYADYVFQTDKLDIQNRRLKQLSKNFRSYVDKPYHYIQPLSPEDAQEIVDKWNPTPEQARAILTISEKRPYFQVIKNGWFFGYCCFEEIGGILQVDFGMNPAYMGGGNGRAFYQAIEDYTISHFEPSKLCIDFLCDDERALAFAGKIGYAQMHSDNPNVIRVLKEL